MTRIARAGAGVLAGILIACVGCARAPLDSGLAPPHQGELISIPGGKGYVEVVKKEPTSAKTPLTAEVSFYFLKDAVTPLSPAPTTGTFAVGKKTVALQSQGEALVTPSGPPLLPKGGLDGVLTVELDGKSLKIPLGVR